MDSSLQRSAKTTSEAGLGRLFKPGSIALVGATERSIWSNTAYDNIQRFKFAGRVHLINRKGGQIYGRAAATSCADVGEQIDAALLMVPEAALLDALADLAAAGGRGAVILSSGFSELGAAGAERQIQVAEAARAVGVRLLGPNCLGHVNYAENCPLWTAQLRRPMADKAVAVVSQSGATAGQLASFAYQQRVGFTHMISTGNEADIDVADAISFLANEDSVRSIALFMESARRPQAFIDAVLKAQRAGKPVVALKVGTSPAAAKAAQAHTGSLVGDDKVFSAVCRQLGVPRVHSIEDLVVVADLIARIGPVDGGLALVGMSGGMCGIAADQAERDGVSVPALAPSTLAKLRALLPDFATPSNPLDVTGVGMLKPELLEPVLAEIGKDPGVGLVTYMLDAPNVIATAGIGRVALQHISAGFKACGKPALMLSHNFTLVSSDARTLVDEVQIIYSGAGLAHGISAIGHLFAWSRTRQRIGRDDLQLVRSGAHPSSEREVLDYLAGSGVSVVPAVVAKTSEEAVVAAARQGGPVVLKILSPDIAHKTEVGGVVLNLQGDEAVREAFETMTESVRRAAPNARIEGIIVSPMRVKGVELFVGTMRDPQWGPVIAVGMGGVLVEALKDTSVRTLPISPADAMEMLDELRSGVLLDGFRGSSPVDRRAAAQAVAAIGNAALALGDDLVSLEVNPLLACGDRIEALDGLTIWAD